MVHAQRQCGKTTAFLALAREINAGGEIVHEMALGRKALALGFLFRGAKYAAEVLQHPFTN